MPPKPKAASKKPKAAKAAKPAGAKKPLKGYMLFASKMRGEIIKKKPSLTFGEVGKELGAAWKKLSDAEKAKYK